MKRMKRIFVFLTMVFVLSSVINVCYANNVLTNGVDSVYHDGKAVIDSVYHDGKSVISTVYTDTKSTISGLYPDIKSAIVYIGKAIGVAAEHVYTVLVKQYVVIGIKHLVVMVLSIISLIIGILLWRKYTNDVMTYKIIMPLMFIVVGLVSMLCFVNYNEMLMGLINPEFGAMKYIIETSQNLVK